MPDFLFEMLVEEIPHGVLPAAENQIKTRLPILLEKYGLSCKDVLVFASPRRLAFLLCGLPDKGAPRVIEQKGPSLKAAYNPDGSPTPALEGFFKTYGARKEDLIQKEIKGQAYLFISKTEEGSPTASILSPFTADFVSTLKFSEPMRWNKGGAVFEFIRPVRGITALLDQNILPLKFFGLEAGNILKGHRQLFPKPLVLAKAGAYESTLKTVGVIPSLDERKALIYTQAAACAEALKAVPALDEELASILACLTEFPHVLAAPFDKAFLEIPKEVLVSEMKVHQKYIPLFSPQGALMPYYLITANIPCPEGETKENVLRGNNRVFQARAEDGAFFYKEDLKKGLEYYKKALASITFVEGGGSLADKTARMKVLASLLQDQLKLQLNAGHLECALDFCKADLASLMVGEFPELQGLMGGYYAQAEGLPQEAALAIKEHYLPLGGENPTQELSALVGLADRLDNLCTLYAVGKTVSGSRDPYALRRQTIAAITLLMQFGWSKFSLSAFLDGAAPLYETMRLQPENEWKDLLSGFVRMRFEGILKGEPYLYGADTLAAVEAAGFDFILADARRAEALHLLRTSKGRNLSSLAELSKRVKNIIKGQAPLALKETFLEEKEEKNLWQAVCAIEQSFPSLNTEQAFQKLLGLEQPVASFFDALMVKCGGEKESARIALLQRLDALFGLLADFSKLSLDA